MDALIDALGGERTFETTEDPWGRRVRVPIALLPNGDVCIETATTATGDAMTAGSHGVGLLIRRAAELIQGAARVLVAVGGTASTDGGTGVARALGWSFLDRDGGEVPSGGAGLRSITRIEPPDEPPEPQVIALCDVDAPLTGETGSARSFAPQKGASPEQVDDLESGLVNLADLVRSRFGLDLDKLPFAGAGGGIAGGLRVFLGAELRSGFSFVAEAMRLGDLVSAADFVITGEGRFDDQSLAGKAPVGVARVAHEQGIPCLGLFGELASAARVALTAGFSDVLSLRDAVGHRSQEEPSTLLTEATRLLLSRQPL